MHFLSFKSFEGLIEDTQIDLMQVQQEAGQMLESQQSLQPMVCALILSSLNHCNSTLFNDIKNRISWI